MLGKSDIDRKRDLEIFLFTDSLPKLPQWQVQSQGEARSLEFLQGFPCGC